MDRTPERAMKYKYVRHVAEMNFGRCLHKVKHTHTHTNTHAGGQCPGWLASKPNLSDHDATEAVEATEANSPRYHQRCQALLCSLHASGWGPVGMTFDTIMRIVSADAIRAR